MSGKEELKETMTEPSIVIDSELKRACPNLQLGTIFADVVVEKRNRVIWDMLQNAGKGVLRQYTLDTLSSNLRLQAAREAYRSLGKDPTRYRVSSEALLRRVLQGKDIYQINNVVDINNLLSIESLLSAGSYDLSRVRGAMVFRTGKPGESYKGIGKETINISELPVFADEDGPFGSPTSDSERAMITLNTRKALMVLISFSGDLNGELTSFLDRGRKLLRNYARGTNISTAIVT